MKVFPYLFIPPFKFFCSLESDKIHRNSDVRKLFAGSSLILLTRFFKILVRFNI